MDDYENISLIYKALSIDALYIWIFQNYRAFPTVCVWIHLLGNN